MKKLLWFTYILSSRSDPMLYRPLRNRRKYGVHSQAQ